MFLDRLACSMVRLPENQLLDAQIPSGELQGSAAPNLLTFSLTPKAAGRWFESSRGHFSRGLGFQPKSLDATGFRADRGRRSLLAPRSETSAAMHTPDTYGRLPYNDEVAPW